MNAIQPSKPPLQPIQKPRVVPRPKRKLRQRSHQVMALETSVKISVNLAISVIALFALVQLLPNHWSQQEKLRQVRTDLKLVEGRVNTLNTEFGRNFDPRQTKNIMQEQGYRFDPTQRRIVIPKGEAGSEPESSP